VPTYTQPQFAIQLQPVVDGYGTTIGYLVPAAVVRPDGPTVFAIVPNAPAGYGTQQQQLYGQQQAEQSYSLVPAFYQPPPQQQPQPVTPPHPTPAAYAAK
jgi:hypothetical protein